MKTPDMFWNSFLLCDW